MPIFTFKSPDGKTYDVTAPEGATEAEAFDMLQKTQNINISTAKPQEENKGFFGGIKDTVSGAFDKAKNLVTGEYRKVKETENMPGIGDMPEMNELSLAGFKTAITTLTSGNDESVKSIMANFPKVAMRKDEKGNYILKSAIDGKEYSIKPGIEVRDIAKVFGTIPLYTPAGKAATMTGKTMGAMATEAGIEGAQELTGGEFDAMNIPLAGTAQGVGSAINMGAQYMKGRNTDLPEAVTLSENLGITPMTSDVFPPDTFIGKLGQSIGERVPLAGSGQMRSGENFQRTEATRDFIRQYGGDNLAMASDNVMGDLIDRYGKTIDKYVSMKSDVIDSVNKKLIREETVTNTISNKADKMGIMYEFNVPIGETSVNSTRKIKGYVPVSNTINEIDRQVEKLKSLDIQGVDKAVNLFQDFKGAFQNKDLKTIELLRKQLGEELKSPDMVSVQSTAETSAKKIYDAVNEDMGNFIKQNGDNRDFVKWKVANKQLSKIMDINKKTILGSVLKKGDMRPEEVRKMLFSQKPSEIKLLHRRLGYEGKRNARMALIQEAVLKSGGIDNLTPDKFIGNINKLSKSTGIFFRGEDKKSLDGLVKALEYTKHAAAAGVKPTTGAELTPYATYALMTIITGSPAVSVVGTAGIGGISRIYESRPMRNLLIKIANAPKGKENELMDQLTALSQSYIQKNGN